VPDDWGESQPKKRGTTVFILCKRFTRHSVELIGCAETARSSAALEEDTIKFLKAVGVGVVILAVAFGVFSPSLTTVYWTSGRPPDGVNDSPRLTPAGNFIFFVSAGNGRPWGIYWVSAAVLDKLKREPIGMEPPPPAVTAPYGSTPRIDGVFAEGEWVGVTPADGAPRSLHLPRMATQHMGGPPHMRPTRPTGLTFDTSAFQFGRKVERGWSSMSATGGTSRSFVEFFGRAS
jgi:hypothetical protein